MEAIGGVNFGMVDEAAVVLLLAGAVLARVVRVVASFRLARVVVTAQAARLIRRCRVVMVRGSRHLSCRCGMHM